jgi:peptidoglycan hydrolase-like protein with peptidoglycan-binding domain
MIKKVVTAIIAFLVFPVLVSAQGVFPFERELFKGLRGEEVRELQEILKQDPEIYPEGLATGYYGRLTERAVKRLQKKFDLPQTGRLDKNTIRLIFPHPDEVAIKVVYPNGDEVLDRGEIHEIRWKLMRPGPPKITPPFPGLQPQEIPETETKKRELKEAEIKRIFWPRGRIDLIREDGRFVRHIATVNLAWQSYDWKISNDIPNGDNYKIRVGLARTRLCPPVALPEETSRVRCHAAAFWLADISDGPFSIVGERVPAPENIRKAIEALKSAIRQLREALSLLEALL